ncbi:MAG: AraC family transcriptional regulator [Neisseriaceae bacterium]|nr:AraC family transcriptional regulator [Neisseriaceae bacterium]MBP6862226.1 AraC family transcriptional regulator [Neisseriaceae bacterium]
MFSHQHYVGAGSRTIQPYFVLSTESTYCKKVVADSPISHFYSFVADRSAGQAFAVPDASVDVLFLCDPDEPKVRVCGSTVTAKLVELQTNKRYFGVRFRPGFIPSFIPLASRDLVGAEVALQDIDSQGQQLLGQISSAQGFDQQVAYFMRQYGHRLARQQSPLCAQVSALILSRHGDVRIHELEAYTGYSSRYINKTFTEHFGLSPKQYCLIVRFQHTLQQLTQANPMSLTNLALEQGYADQSHFLREFKKFAALAPTKFVQALSQSHYQARILLSAYE